MDKANTKQYERAEKARAKVKDRRRIKHTIPPTGEASKVVPKSKRTTIYPNTVHVAGPDDFVLTDGRYQRKIGGDVLSGRLKGARMYALSLVERETCPRTCPHWQDCYTNNMPLLKRWKHGKALQQALRRNVAQVCAEEWHVVIRLHISGDFYSFGYLKEWVKLLDKYDNLTLFGFTAWPTSTKIGAGIARVRKALPDRFLIRTSDTTGDWGSFGVDFPTELKFMGDAVVCPEQRDAMDTGKRSKHCGNCGVCFYTSRPIVFAGH